MTPVVSRQHGPLSHGSRRTSHQDVVFSNVLRCLTALYRCEESHQQSLRKRRNVRLREAAFLHQ